MKETAVLFLIFNRPDTAEQVMTVIRSARPPRLYIAADGPRSDVQGEAELCQQTRAIVSSLIDWDCKVFTLFRDSNQGCARAVSGAIDWFFSNEEMGIILEDDCFPDASFFFFCNELLHHYKSDNRVMHISGYNDQSSHNANDTYYFSHYPRIWGWASWRRAWKFYELQPTPITEKQKSMIIAKYFYNFKGAGENWFKDFNRSYKKLSTWDYQWCLCIWKQHGLSINSSIPLIKNIGFDGRGSHTTKPSEEVLSMKLLSLSGPVIHPVNFIPDPVADIISIRQNLYPDFKTRLSSKWNSLAKALKLKNP